LTHRLFISLNIPGDIKNKIVDLRNSVIVNKSNYKWEKEDKLHLTLKFIGDVEENLIEKIIDKISFLKEEKHFECELTGFGVFYQRKIPKILWAGININPDPSGIILNLNYELEQLNIPKEEKPFRPHLTILRLKGFEGEDFINAFKNYKFNSLNFISNEISLRESKLLRSGSVYNEINKFILK
jgi:2'-5' RNA ligase